MNQLIINNIDAPAFDKQTIELRAETLSTLVKDGHINPLEAVANIEVMIQTLTTLKEKISDDVLNEVSKHGKEATFQGVKFQKREGGVKYDFSNCGHVTYQEWLSRKNEADAKCKKYEATIKTLQSKTIMVDESTGESFEVFPPIKTSKSTVAITLPKQA